MYILNLSDGNKITLGDLQLKGLSGIKLKNEINNYLKWLEKPTIQRSKNPIIAQYVSYEMNIATLNERLNSPLPESVKSKLEKQLDDLLTEKEHFMLDKSLEISNASTEENFDEERAYEIFFKLLKNLKDDIDTQYLSYDFFSFEEVLAILKKVNEVKNNEMKNFLISSQ